MKLLSYIYLSIKLENMKSLTKILITVLAVVLLLAIVILLVVRQGQIKTVIDSQISFEDVTEKAGLIEPLKGMMGHGAAWGDVTGNGYPDLFYGTFVDRDESHYNVRGHTGGASPNKLFLNNGDGTFTEVMDSPIRFYGRNSGVAFADFNNNGHLDLIVSDNYKKPYGAISGNRLYKNDGKGNFTDVTDSSGLYFEAPFFGRNTFVFDYNGDGLLDIFMQEDFVSSAGTNSANSRLMKNIGNLKFKDVTAEAGFPHGFQEGFWGLGGFVGDINGNGWPDVFFAHSCQMFLNNQDGTFREKKYDHLVNPESKLPSPVNSDWTAGADLGDLTNNGKMDIVIGDHFSDASGYHRLYVLLNEGNDANGDPILRDITFEAGVTEMGHRGPHVQLQDIDNDGWVDIMVSNCDDFIYRNKGVVDSIPRFEKPVGSGFTGGIGYWAAGPLGDYDRDGRLDFIGPDWNPGFVSPLLRNVTKGANNYLAIKMELENRPNRNGIDARVEIFKKGMLGEKEGLLGTRLITVSNGYSSGYEAIAYFGVPKNKVVDVRVTMPAGGPVFTATSVKRNQMFVFK